MACHSIQEEVDLLVYNGVIYTADSAFSVVNSLAIHDGLIVDTGDYQHLSKKYKVREYLDLEGLSVYPGFIDAHCHFFGYGLLEETKVNLVGVSSPEVMLERLVKFHQVHPAPYLEGRGWDQNLWDRKEFPDKSLLDIAFPDIPVLLTRIDGHAMLVNSKALNLASITRDSHVDGGEVLLKEGKPTGMLIDNAMTLVKDIIPAPDVDLIQRALLKAQADCFAHGLTMVADAGLKANIIDHISELQRSGLLQMRVYAMLDPDEQTLSRYMAQGPLDSDKLVVRAIKLYADGALGSRGALLLEPYQDMPLHQGLALISKQEMRQYCQMASDHGFQVNVHAIGDSAVRMVLNVFSQFLTPGNDLRWRVEHAQVVHPADLNSFGEYAIIPSIQATHATSDMHWAADRLGERVTTAYAYRDLMLQNGWVPNGTDFPIEQIDPIMTFHAAVFRQDKQGFPEMGFQAENALSREEALLSITRWAAKACFTETRNGSLEPGKKADFVILDHDIMQVDPSQLRATRVLKTFLDGKRVYPL